MKQSSITKAMLRWKMGESRSTLAMEKYTTLLTYVKTSFWFRVWLRFPNGLQFLGPQITAKSCIYCKTISCCSMCPLYGRVCMNGAPYWKNIYNTLYKMTHSSYDVRKNLVPTLEKNIEEMINALETTEQW